MFSIRNLLAAVALLVAAAPLAAAAEPVTIDNFRRAETDHHFLAYVSKGCFAKLCNERSPAPVDKQDVVRTNRDTPYSVGIFDLTSPLTITKPNTGRRFQSMQIINQDHYILLVAYDAGTYTLTREQAGTRYVAVVFRTFMDPNDAADIKATHAAQDEIRVAQVDPGKFEVPDWDANQRAKLSAALGALMVYVPDSRGMFGGIGTVDPVRHLIGTAGGWGGNPEEDAKYISGVVKLNDGKTSYLLTLKDVPVDGFWSVTVYNAQGFYEAPENAISVNNVTGKRNADGSMTIRLGGDPAAANYLRIMSGWSYIARLYRPRSEVVGGKWIFPEPVPVR
jgi:hypothetical protein